MNSGTPGATVSARPPDGPARHGSPVRHDGERCRNCDAVLTGRFCASCGQSADVHVPSTRELIHEALEGITHSDSRLWRTLKLLWLEPGRITLEFIAGRRTAYLPPFRLYLVLSVIFFLAASLMHVTGGLMPLDSMKVNGRPAAAEECRQLQVDIFDSRRWEERARHACEAVVRDRGESLVHVVLGTMPKAMFIFLPLIAFFHMLLYWHPRHRYAEHLLFFLHLHAFFFSVMTLAVLVSRAGASWHATGRAAEWANDLLMWCLPVYAIIAMHRVFQRGWPSTLFKAFVLSLAYLFVLAWTVATVFVYAMLQL